MESSEELLLHGYVHRRERSRGLVSWLAEDSDEMNALALDDTRSVLEQGQRVFTDVFGARARGFLAPAWQPGRVREVNPNSLGLTYTLGFFSLESSTGRSVPLATHSWDCGRWGWLGHVGHGIGGALQWLSGRVPSVAIHPRDLARGFWPQILRRVEALLASGYEPRTPASLLEARDAEVAV
jgi:hypothetical protein